MKMHELGLNELNAELEGLNLEGHWRLVGVTLAEPEPYAAPEVWRWQDIRRVLVRAGEIGGIEGGASRRTVRLCTPGVADKWATQTIHASVQLVNPGEIAEAHRHTMGALRFIVEGTGGYTNVEGEKFHLEPADLILTPQWTWHDHGNEGDGPVLWVDGHDFPVVNRLNALFFQKYAAEQQPVEHDDPFTHPYVYRGRDVLPRLQAMEEKDWDPFDAFALDYVNPVTGGYTLSTIACRLQRLPKRKQTRRQRGTPSQIYQVVSGSGKTLAGGKTLTWQSGDLFVIPGWTWYEHVNDGEEDAILFSMNDEPVLNALALLRKER